jgi:hypothetical protein
MSVFSSDLHAVGMSHSLASFEDLPMEIHLEILDVLETGSGCDLFSLSLVCRYLRLLVSPRIFKSISLSYDWSTSHERYQALIEALTGRCGLICHADTKALPSLVRSIKISLGLHGHFTAEISTFMNDIIPRLPNLQRLSLFRVFIGAQMIEGLVKARSLEELTISKCFLSGKDMPIETLESIRRLPIKVFTSIHGQYHREIHEYLPFERLERINQSVDAIPLSQICMSLHTLEIEFVTDLEGLMSQLQGLENLTTLIIREVQKNAILPSLSLTDREKHIPMVPNLTSLFCPPTLVCYFEGSPLLSLYIPREKANHEPYRRSSSTVEDLTYLPPFPLLQHLSIPAGLLRDIHMASSESAPGIPSLPLKDLYPKLTSLDIDYRISHYSSDLPNSTLKGVPSSGLHSTVLDLCGLSSRLPPSIREISLKGLARSIRMRCGAEINASEAEGKKGSQLEVMHALALTSAFPKLLEFNVSDDEVER